MSESTLREQMRAGNRLAGTFVKTPAHEIVEVLAASGLNFIALDAEHASFDRARLDACLAVARALDFPVLVRVPEGSQANILMALDAGATGVIVPHVDTLEKAQNIARWARFGHGGRGYAGSTRWAGFTTRAMADVLAQSTRETIVVAQIEEPEGVELVDDIAAVDGIDGLFVGPADLAVCYGVTDLNDPQVRAAMTVAGKACHANNKTLMTFAPTPATAAELQTLGVSMFFISSEHGFMLAGARDAATQLKAL